jgi:hypothetical protein
MKKKGSVRSGKKAVSGSKMIITRHVPIHSKPEDGVAGRSALPHILLSLAYNCPVTAIYLTSSTQASPVRELSDMAGASVTIRYYQSSSSRLPASAGAHTRVWGFRFRVWGLGVSRVGLPLKIFD